MPYYQDAETLYACLNQLLDRVQRQAPEGAEGLSRARFTVRLKFTAPTAEIFFDGRPRPFRTIFNGPKARADLELELAGDTLHQVLLGNLTVTNAVGNQLIKLRGPVWKVYPLADMLQAGQQFYPQILSERKFGKASSASDGDPSFRDLTPSRMTKSPRRARFRPQARPPQ